MKKLSAEKKIINENRKSRADDIFERIEHTSGQRLRQAWQDLSAMASTDDDSVRAILETMTTSRRKKLESAVQSKDVYIWVPSGAVFHSLNNACNALGTTLKDYCARNEIAATSDRTARRNADRPSDTPPPPVSPDKGSKRVLPFKPKTGL